MLCGLLVTYFIQHHAPFYRAVTLGSLVHVKLYQKVCDWPGTHVLLMLAHIQAPAPICFRKSTVHSEATCVCEGHTRDC